jgi:hypothetical protein
MSRGGTKMYIEHLFIDEAEVFTEECDGCGGVGFIDEGNCEDGVWGMCPECNGTGVTEL